MAFTENTVLLHTNQENVRTTTLSLFFAIVCIIDIFGVFPIITLPKTIIDCGKCIQFTCVYGLIVVPVICLLQIYTATLLGKSWLLACKIQSNFIQKERYPYTALAELAFGRKLSKCVTILLNITAIEEPDKGLNLAGVFIHYSRASDTVYHSVIRDKLFIYGIRGTAFKFVKSYLLNRTQYVKIGSSVTSDIANLAQRAPQRSVLGPFLFAVYINGLCFYLSKCNNIHLCFYADDTVIIITEKNSKVLCQQINNVYERVKIWSNKNNLCLDETKIHYNCFQLKERNCAGPAGISCADDGVDTTLTFGLICSLSVLTVASVFFVVIICLLQLNLDPQNMQEEAGTNFEENSIWINIVIAYGVLIFQFDIHPTILAIQIDMEKRHKINLAIFYGFGGNIDIAWQELTKKCMNGVWKKIWPKVSQDYQREEPIVGQIVNIVETAGLGDVYEEDIEEFLQVSGEGLTYDDLQLLTKQGIEEGENSGSEDGV
ncbi:reverse transcriptase (rna-dependent dna polymerase) [Holotrichia oblita]|uniref:Reverse transcriptase (Rna-dependent dna polymerase) n=1 Tax=Holotrichia oblita TaxID=644536 RepID=A0ACB9TEH2_HOLOL|nr:reverse transcriptase (rna-dependent dna polymerase) [Holotrichia oblita]